MIELIIDLGIVFALPVLFIALITDRVLNSNREDVESQVTETEVRKIKQKKDKELQELLSEA